MASPLQPSVAGQQRRRCPLGAARPAWTPQELPRCFPASRPRSAPCRSLPAIGPALQAAAPALLAPHPGITAGVLANTTVYVLGIRVLLAGLTWAGVFNSWLLGCASYSAFGIGGYALVCLYFIIGSLVTKIRLEEKIREGIAEKREGRRSVGSVWGSGLAGTICALAAMVTGDYPFWQVGFVANFGSKLSDTVSSEVGKAYGKTTYLITTFEKCPRGTEGAISLEGTAAGIGAAAVYSFLAFLFGQVSLAGCGVVFLACVTANFMESYLGAALQGKLDFLTNDVVNMIQISVAAILAIAGQAAWVRFAV
ncbi:unnamed protein product [Ostreobium quekettii]|uniref:DUF92 domain-containing protein n=1 Tax=Ostreobium quekettii TaxID=121088 RepID=A0A8S1IXI3_9CHLO|nr:unnamed protein product [Ostreobium quekettii]|eukprot:evm.model.scf_972.5 EVM.evm.TU.scf_972.5   scf_972:30985-35898(+)